MRFTGGWIKLHRSLLDSWIATDALALALFVKILARANFKDTRIMRNGNLITIKRGQLVTSIHELAGELSRRATTRRLELLESDGSITLQRDHRGTIITVCNYEEYQSDSVDQCTTEGTTEAQQKHNRSTTEGTRIKNSKNAKKVKKGEEGAEAPSPPYEVFLAYSNAFEKRYGSKPVYNAVEWKICEDLMERLGGWTNAVEAVQTYLNSNKKFYLERLHSLAVLLQDCETVYAASQIQKGV